MPVVVYICDVIKPNVCGFKTNLVQNIIVGFLLGELYSVETSGAAQNNKIQRKFNVIIC